MLLDPESKSKHLKKHWGNDLTTIALEQAEYTYKARYIQMYGNGFAPAISCLHKSAHSKLNTLFWELSDDEDDASTPSSTSPPANAEKPCLDGFNRYLNSTDILGDMTILR
ncbi:hypothetical protein C0991_003464 [Blastosporella zonata]|nr:hypothetical protein C0991_003464 [Blastosporella zonata]